MGPMEFSKVPKAMKEFDTLAYISAWMAVKQPKKKCYTSIAAPSNKSIDNIL